LYHHGPVRTTPRGSGALGARHLNTLDALQLAVALHLRGRGMVDELVTADHVLVAVAPLEGVPVFNPESP
jgi:hypothetical protein